MTSDALPAKGGEKMNFPHVRVEELWGRARRDPKWRHDGGPWMVHERGNKLKLENGKWISG